MPRGNLKRQTSTVGQKKSRRGGGRRRKKTNHPTRASARIPPTPKSGLSNPNHPCWNEEKKAKPAPKPKPSKFEKLILACQRHDSVTDLLLESGVECCQIQDEQGNTVLHHAAAANNPSAVDLCMRFGVDVNARNQQGQTALHVACSSHNPSGPHRPRGSHSIQKQMECIHLLVNASPDLLDIRDNQGRTPLFNCLSFVGAGCSFNLLLTMSELGADFSVTDHRNQNLVHHIVQEAGCHRAETMPPRVLFETQCLFRWLINCNPTMLCQRDNQGPHGMTAFMAVCFWGNLDLIFYFLKEHCAIQELLQS